jgi:formamidopyrimidine-DNA glycosylase
LQLHLEDGKSVLFRDVRKFGKIYLFEDSEEGITALFSRLGPEPLSESYTLKEFLEKMGARKLPVKSLLLDQRFIAGVGNIYADEALFEAGVHPARRVLYLRKYEKIRIFETVPLVLEKGIRAGGTTISDFVDSDGATGGFQEKLNVYGREGQRCYRCDSLILKTRVAQRGTHFCPVCQKR